MKNEKVVESPSTEDDLQPEYDLDYTRSKPNRFADRFSSPRTIVTLDPDVAEVFTSSESVNTVLRALIDSMPSLPTRS